MLQKIRRGMEKWGHYLLALLCAGVIMLSTVWTRQQQGLENADQAALSDQGQRLAEAQQTPEPAAFIRPAAGIVTRGYTESPVFFPETGVWMVHPGLDFKAATGENVCAMAAGTVISCGEEIRIDHGNGFESLCRGVLECRVNPGQKVRAGELIGTAGSSVPFEGQGHVCVMLFQDGKPIVFGEDWY
ncbi:MAG: M23 family metallopeptidase [Clostridia bacterium]|nr:M23 family metallopeptidase [Clostridia bacterium]